MKHATHHFTIIRYQNCNLENLMAMCLHFSLLGCWSSVVSSFHTHICTHATAVCEYAGWLRAVFYFIFNVIEIYSVCLSSETFFCSIAYIVCFLYIHQIIFSSCLPFIHSFNVWSFFGSQRMACETWMDYLIAFDCCCCIHITTSETHSYVQKKRHLDL